MKFRMRRDVVVSWSRFFWCTLFVFCLCVFFTSFTFSTFRLFFGETFHPVLGSTWRSAPVMEVIHHGPPLPPAVSVRETVMLPDQVLVFLKFPSSVRLSITKEDLHCLYSAVNTSEPQLSQPPLRMDGEDLDNQIVRCPLPPRGFILSLGLNSYMNISVGPMRRWHTLAYEALIDRDNTTVVFIKGFHLRPERVSDSSRFECVYGWDFSKTRFLLRSEAITIAQEIVRCKTPLSVLNGPNRRDHTVKVSVRIKGGGMLPTIARLVHESGPADLGRPDPDVPKPYEMCICTMLHNQARFIREWIMYHGRIGVQRWFIYDNNSDDDINDVISLLVDLNYNITRHIWPWIKTQEAGFAHCALRARSTCEWVGFIDVDEFFHLPLELTLHEVLINQSRVNSNVGELRVTCHNFGPSGLKHVPKRGVVMGYTCRMGAPERHKSIVRTEALNKTLINVVHHFHLRDGFDFVNVDRDVMVINHYKYQVWEVFKEKFYRRVATYVADWQDDQNVGSKDRAPGLGTRAVEPPDWPKRFCEVYDYGLRNKVWRKFLDPNTKLLPWQEEDNGNDEEMERMNSVEGKKKDRNKRRNLHLAEVKKRKISKRRQRVMVGHDRGDKGNVDLVSIYKL